MASARSIPELSFAGFAGEKTDYVSGPNGTLARITNDVVTYLHPDHLGSAQAGTRANGTVAWREQYTPFGEQLQNPAANDNLDGFTGHIKDSDTGLNPCIFPSENCTVQARYYDPVIGRFLSVDPVGFLDTGDPRFFNRYAYTFNDPINLTDPIGECPVTGCAGFRPSSQGGHVRGPIPATHGPSPSAVRTATAQRAISYVRNATGVSNNISIDYTDSYAALSRTIGVLLTDSKDETYNGTVESIDGVTQNGGTEVTIFRSAVEPTDELRTIRFVDENGNPGASFTNDPLTGMENAIKVLGHEVGGHVQGHSGR